MSTLTTSLRRATASATLLALLVAQPVLARVVANGPTPAPSVPAAPATPGPQAQDEGSVPCKLLNQLAQGDFGPSSFFAAPAPAAPKGTAPAAEAKPCLVLRGLA